MDKKKNTNKHDLPFQRAGTARQASAVRSWADLADLSQDDPVTQRRPGTAEEATRPAPPLAASGTREATAPDAPDEAAAPARL